MCRPILRRLMLSQFEMLVVAFASSVWLTLSMCVTDAKVGIRPLGPACRLSPLLLLLRILLLPRLASPTMPIPTLVTSPHLLCIKNRKLNYSRKRRTVPSEFDDEFFRDCPEPTAVSIHHHMSANVCGASSETFAAKRRRFQTFILSVSSPGRPPD